MSRTQLLLCLFGVSAIFFNNVEARLEGEGIIGGDDTKDGQFSYQISLQVDGQHRCGGSILSDLFVITAAHCVINEVNDFTRDPLKVVAGISDFKSRSKRRVTVNVTEVFVPKEYEVRVNNGTLRVTGDIAVLKLSKSLNLEANSHLGKVELPTTDETYEGKKANISGFGWNDVEVAWDPSDGSFKRVSGKTYGKMRFAVANVISNDQCQRIYFPATPIAMTHLCATVEQRDEKKPEGLCAGDSGGPLVYQGVQIGVDSNGPTECVENRFPSIYTRVSDYLDFIKKAVGGCIDNSIRSTIL